MEEIDPLLTLYVNMLRNVIGSWTPFKLVVMQRQLQKVSNCCHVVLYFCILEEYRPEVTTLREPS